MCFHGAGGQSLCHAFIARQAEQGERRAPALLGRHLSPSQAPGLLLHLWLGEDSPLTALHHCRCLSLAPLLFIPSLLFLLPLLPFVLFLLMPPVFLSVLGHPPALPVFNPHCSAAWAGFAARYWTQTFLTECCCVLGSPLPFISQTMGSSPAPVLIHLSS